MSRYIFFVSFEEETESWKGIKALPKYRLNDTFMVEKTNKILIENFTKNLVEIL